MTGEVVYDEKGNELESAAATSVLAMLTPIELMEYEPLMPEDVENLIRILADRIERAPAVTVVLYEEVHRAEEAYQKAFSKHVINAPNQQITMAKEYAKFHTADELHTLNLAKEKFRYAEWLAAALTSKLYGYLNINKSITASFVGQSRR